MDISLLNKGTLKIKGKNATIVIDPRLESPKTEADAIVLLRNSKKEISSKIENPRVTIDGPGEYEIGGIKISSFRVDGSLIYDFNVDGIRILLGDPNALGKAHEKISSCQIALLNVSQDFDQSVISTLEPSVAILYGEAAEESVKKLGLNIKSKTSKYSVASEKIPEEFEAVILE